MDRFVCAAMLWTKVGAALQSCHHANDQLWRADLLLAEEAHIREEQKNVGISRKLGYSRDVRYNRALRRDLNAFPLHSFYNRLTPC